MKLKLECIACILKQIIEVGRLCTDDEKKIRRVVNDFGKMISDFDYNTTAPKVTEITHAILKRELGVKDLYQNYKERHIKVALNLYPVVKKLIDNADNTIEAALIMAATGNSIDAGVNTHGVDIEKAIKLGIKEGLYNSSFKLFMEKIKDSSKLLIVADNSGEAVFDKLLIEELLKKYDLEITYAVRSEPVLNDVTLKEAKQIGIDKVCNLIASGAKAPGMIIEEGEKNFIKIFKETDIVISKGQGNYEALTEVDRPIFYLLQAKCNIIANEFKAPVGSLIFKYLE